jgi:hypothetical protein
MVVLLTLIFNSQTRHNALLVQERVKAVLAGSELNVLTVSNSGIVTFAEGRRSAFLRLPSSDPVVGKQFSELWTEAVLNEEVRKVPNAECSEMEFDTVITDASGKRQHYRYRVRLVPPPALPFVIGHRMISQNCLTDI